MCSQSGSEFFVLVDFLRNDKRQEVSVISSSSIVNCTDTFEKFYARIDKTVKVKCDSSSGKKGRDEEEFYFAKVLSHSFNRPGLVALMGTYIKTGQLTTPSTSKRGRIPRTLDSGSESDEIGRVSHYSPENIKKKKKFHKAKKNSASLQAARDIMASYSNQVSAHGSATSEDNMATLRAENEKQAATILDLKSQLRAVTAERDAMLETHRINQQMAADLRRSLKYANRMQSPSRPSSGASSASESLSTGFSEDGTTSLHSVEHSHLRQKRSDPGVVQLGKSTIFINEINFNAVINGSTSCTMLARNLLELVYNTQALESCSARGRKANGLGKSAESREPLYQPGINAIIDFTITHGKAHHWTVRDTSSIVAAMGKRLNEIRAVAKLCATSISNQNVENQL